MLRTNFPKSLLKWISILSASALVIVIGYVVVTQLTALNDASESEILPEGVVKLVNERLESSFTDDEILSIESVQEAPYWPVENSLFYINYTGDYASGLDIYYEQSDLVTPDEVAQERAGIISAIAESLTNQGFIKKADEGYGQTADIYIDDFTVCSINSGSQSNISPPLSLRCGSLDLYSTDLENYQSSKEFADAYTAASGVIKQGDVFHITSEESSSIEEYQKLTAILGSLNNIASQELAFYKQGDESWRYFANTQGILPCSKYNTSDLRAAFRGDSCLDSTNKQSIVE